MKRLLLSLAALAFLAAAQAKADEPAKTGDAAKDAKMEGKKAGKKAKKKAKKAKADMDKKADAAAK